MLIGTNTVKKSALRFKTYSRSNETESVVDTVFKEVLVMLVELGYPLKN